eukprot:8661573-Alexandrium_andersonii.AAC.1
MPLLKSAVYGGTAWHPSRSVCAVAFVVWWGVAVRPASTVSRRVGAHRRSRTSSRACDLRSGLDRWLVAVLPWLVRRGVR